LELAKNKCLPCEGGMPPLTPERVESLLSELRGWSVVPGKSELRKRFALVSFRATMDLVVRLADLAEEEGHHPDFCVHYRVLDVTLTTHAIGGLSENDFILAAKVDALDWPGFPMLHRPTISPRPKASRRQRLARSEQWSEGQRPRIS
jgi:4a-hydroxytetrahydrobiopterin dehydratase